MAPPGGTCRGVGFHDPYSIAMVSVIVLVAVAHSRIVAALRVPISPRTPESVQAIDPGFQTGTPAAAQAMSATIAMNRVLLVVEHGRPVAS
jgi:hypothetical protein